MENKNRGGIMQYLAVGEMFTYLVRVFRKPRPGEPAPNFNLRMMHGINKISIIMFLIGVIFMIVKRIF